MDLIASQSLYVLRPIFMEDALTDMMDLAFNLLLHSAQQETRLAKLTLLALMHIMQLMLPARLLVQNAQPTELLDVLL
jgi:hypothetical protein